MFIIFIMKSYRDDEMKLNRKAIIICDLYCYNTNEICLSLTMKYKLK